MGEIVLSLSGCVQRQDAYGNPTRYFDLIGTIHGTAELIGEITQTESIMYIVDEIPVAGMVLLDSDPAWSFPATLGAAPESFNVVVEYSPTSTQTGTIWLTVSAGISGDTTASSDLYDVVALAVVSWALVSSITQRQDACGNKTAKFDVVGAICGAGAHIGQSLLIETLSIVVVGEEDPIAAVSSFDTDDPAWSSPTTMPGTATAFNVVFTYSADDTYDVTGLLNIQIGSMLAWVWDTSPEFVLSPVTNVHTMYITPNLGWASRTRMLNPAHNPLSQLINFSDLVSTELADKGYISGSYRVISPGGVTYLLPAAVVNKLFGDNIECIYKCCHDTSPRKTILRKSTGASE